MVWAAATGFPHTPEQWWSHGLSSVWWRELTKSLQFFLLVFPWNVSLLMDVWSLNPPSSPPQSATSTVHQVLHWGTVCSLLYCSIFISGCRHRGKKSLVAVRYKMSSSSTNNRRILLSRERRDHREEQTQWTFVTVNVRCSGFEPGLPAFGCHVPLVSASVTFTVQRHAG